MNQAAKDLLTGNLVAFEEFTAYEDSDYDSSDCEEELTTDKSSEPAPTDKPIKPPPKADKNHDVKPKESFLTNQRLK